jgi:hypothetical protein
LLSMSVKSSLRIMRNSLYGMSLVINRHLVLRCVFLGGVIVSFVFISVISTVTEFIVNTVFLFCYQAFFREIWI